MSRGGQRVIYMTQGYKQWGAVGISAKGVGILIECVGKRPEAKRTRGKQNEAKTSKMGIIGGICVEQEVGSEIK